MRPLVATFLAASLAAFGGCGSKKGPPADWVARVEAFAGEVRLAVGDADKLVIATKGAHLRVGGQLVTGADGQATLLLRNGGRLAVKPRTILRLRSGSGKSKLGLRLMQGSVEGTGPQVAAADLVITVGGRKVRLAGSARATITAPTEAARAAIIVSLGSASVEDENGVARKVVAGETLQLTLTRKKPKPDAGVPKADAKVVSAPTLVFFLQNKGRGRVLVRQPGERGFRPVRRGQVIAIKPGTQLKLARGARVVVGNEKGKGTAVQGPAQLVVRESATPGPDGKPGVRLDSTGGDLTIADRGKPGKRGSKLTVEGVTLETRVTYRTIDVRVRRDKGRAIVTVHNGEALLTDKNGKVTRVEAGQHVTASKGLAGTPSQPPLASLQIKRAGAMRVFTSARNVPVTLRWDPSLGPVLVEVARNGRFGNPLFSDVLRRSVLTLPAVPRGMVYWRVRPMKGGKAGKGIQGRLALLVDTSYRVLKTRPPHNTIDQSFGNTTVYYQNALPRFTFRWRPVSGAKRYQLKIFRENNLSRPLLKKETRRTKLRLRTALLAEGRFLWYVSARSRSGALVASIKSRRLSIRYDNATPDLQIVYPRNGVTVAGASLEVRGVAMRGSRVFVNGVAATLDDAYRFRHTVALKPGPNKIVFRVEDKRRGSSVYLRHVVRR